MAKLSVPIKDMQRIAKRLRSLLLRCVTTTEGPHLLARPLHGGTDELWNEIGAHGAPSPSTLARLSGGPLYPIRTAFLAAVERDLAVLSQRDDLLALTHDAPRLFDGSRLTQRDLALFRTRYEAIKAPPDESLAPHWRFLAELHDPDTAARAEQLTQRLLWQQRQNRLTGRHKLEGLLCLLRAEPLSMAQEEQRESIEDVAHAVASLRALPWRSQRKKLARVLAGLLGTLPASELPATPPEPLAFLSAYGEQLLRALHRGKTQEPNLTRDVFCAALVLPPREQDQEELDTYATVERLHRFSYEAEQYRALSSLGRALHLSAIIEASKPSEEQVRALASLHHEGLSLEQIALAASHQQLPRLSECTNAAAARFFCRAILPIVVRAKELSLSLDLPLEELRGSREEELHVLSRILLAQSTSRLPPNQHAAFAELTFGLLRRAPQRARGCLSVISSPTQGAGRARFPAYAEWLGDDALLDEYLHLCALVGEEASPSNSLLLDFTRDERRREQRDFLAELSAPSEAQRARLERLRGELLTERPAADRTRRRMRERVEVLRATAYRQQLDRALRELQRSIIQAEIPLTPPWRNAIRFFLVVEHNREPLRALLRRAATDPRRAYAADTHENRAWRELARPHFDLETWLAPRQKTITLHERRYHLALEEDVLEILQMGVPFETCLSLNGGSNAASTIVNALDDNKRVLYVRNARGAVVGRKLLALTEDHRLLGYRFYCAVDKESELAQEVYQFCTDLARDARLALSDQGVPARLHGEFWYDDAARPWQPPQDEERERLSIPALCLSVPAHQELLIASELALQRAIERASPTEMSAALERANRSQATFHSAPIAAQLGMEALAVLQQRDANFRAVFFQHAAAQGPDVFLRALNSLADGGSSEAMIALQHLPPSPQIGRGLLRWLYERLRQGFPPDDYGMEILSLLYRPILLEGASGEELLARCDLLGPLWEGYRASREVSTWPYDEAKERLWKFIRADFQARPWVEPLLSATRDKRRDPLSHEMALRLLATFPLAAARAGAPLYSPHQRRPRADFLAQSALSELLRLRPALRTSPWALAAWLRQRDPSAPLDGAPSPSTDPIHSLGDLLLYRPSLCQELVHWLDTKSYGSLRGTWELAVLRRSKSRLARRLVTEIEEQRPDADDALTLLQRMGAVEQMEPLCARQPLPLALAAAAGNAPTALARVAAKHRRQTSWPLPEASAAPPYTRDWEVPSVSPSYDDPNLYAWAWEVLPRYQAEITAMQTLSKEHPASTALALLVEHPLAEPMTALRYLRGWSPHKPGAPLAESMGSALLELEPSELERATDLLGYLSQHPAARKRIRERAQRLPHWEFGQSYLAFLHRGAPRELLHLLVSATLAEAIKNPGQLYSVIDSILGPIPMEALLQALFAEFSPQAWAMVFAHLPNLDSIQRFFARLAQAPASQIGELVYWIEGLPENHAQRTTRNEWLLAWCRQHPGAPEGEAEGD